MDFDMFDGHFYGNRQWQLATTVSKKNELQGTVPSTIHVVNCEETKCQVNNESFGRSSATR